MNIAVKPSHVDLSANDCSITEIVLEHLTTKFPNYDFAVFGKQLYVDDKSISFPYSDTDLAKSKDILSRVERMIEGVIND